jgi:hypothetical protein
LEDDKVHLNMGIYDNYEINCSGFINHVLVSERFTKALEEIREFVFATNDRTCYKNTYYPRALTFVRFMLSEKQKKYWSAIKNVNEIEPGDIIAYAKELHKVTDGGQHMMIVSNQIKATTELDWFHIPVFDSTSGHGPNDKRGDKESLGEGIIGLEFNGNKFPKRLKWSPESAPSETTIVVARIKD